MDSSPVSLFLGFVRPGYPVMPMTSPRRRLVCCFSNGTPSFLANWAWQTTCSWVPMLRVSAEVRMSSSPDQHCPFQFLVSHAMAVTHRRR